MTLSDILGRGVQLEWHEAVAVVRDIVERCEGTALVSIPAFDQVELLPAGRVELHGGLIVDGPVERLVQMLETLITPQKPPAQFTELMREPPASLQAFSISLAYFERPNRTAILRDLYSRASGNSPLPNADELIASLRAKTEPAATDIAEQPAESVSRRPPLIYAAILLSVIGASVIAVLVWRGAGGSSVAGASSTLTAKVSDAVGEAVASLAERAGLGGDAQPAPVEAAPPEPPATTPPVSTRRAESPVKPKTSPPLLPAPESFAVPTGRKGQALPGESLEGPQRSPLEVPVITPAGPVAEVVYSPSSPGVIPPVGVRPHVPKTLPTGVKSEDVARIEIVIRSDGTVGSVKLLGPPRMNDPGLLSAAKAWRFRPATLDGRAVPYRTTVLVAR
jgi:hypothetical protein